MLSKNRETAARKLARACLLVSLAVLLTAPVGSAAPPAVEQPPVLLDEMIGPRPALVLVAPTPGVEIVRQAIEQGDAGVAGGAAFGEAEHLTLAIPPGASATLGYAIPPAPVIDELRLEAWVWCNRPGIQLAAVIVLPRSKDPATGESRRIVVRSGETAEADGWRRITLENVTQLTERQVRVARAQYGAIDDQEAYVSHVAVLAPGGLGATDVWVDRIAVYGALKPRGEGGEALTTAQLAAAWVEGSPTGPGVGGSTARTPRREPPLMPRIIQWQGEPLEALSRLGFDAVWMGRLPDPSELAEAERLGLWMVCPPPPIEALEARGVGAEFDGVLAWDLGELADAADVTLAEQWARALVRHESVPTRPTVLRPLAMPREASRIAEVMVLGRPTVGATTSWLEQATWLSQTRQLGRAGAVVWAAIDTQRSPAALAQLAALRSERTGGGTTSYGCLAHATTAAFAAWPRGFWFQSHSSLAAPDAETRMRAAALELANLRLGMIEPWLARGKAATPARASRDDLTAMVLTVERSHLVIPMRWSKAAGQGTEPGRLGVDGSFHTPYVVNREVSFVLPSVPESCDAYLLTVAGPRQLATRRVTGGLSVTVEYLPDDAFLLLTEDGFAFTQVERYLRRYGARAAQARVELAELSRHEAVGAARRLSPALLQSVGAAAVLAAVDANMVATHRTLASQDYAAAFARAEQVSQALDDLRERLFLAMWPDGAAGASPLRGDWESLPDMERVAVVTAGATAARVPFPGGDFEDLTLLLESGWRRNDDAGASVAGSVRLSSDEPQSGTYCLELEATPTDTRGRAPTLTTPPVWITSPPLTAPAGHLLEITGWARVMETPVGSADPLLVFDSIGGEESAVRIVTAPSWQPFRLVRACPPGAECRLTIALGGIGRAAVDGVQYRFVPMPVAGGMARR